MDPDFPAASALSHGAPAAVHSQLAALDAGCILQALPADIAAGIRQLEVLESVDSTNTVLLAGEIPASGCSILLAESQTSGRGRLGRVWVSPARAHLYLSLARRFRGRLAGLSLVAGIAAAEALRSLHGLDVGLKWPNDLLLQGRKLGGILVESAGQGVGGLAAVIGLGINVRMPAPAADDIAQPWIDLAAALPQAQLDRSRLAAAVITQLLPALELFDAEGFELFLPRFARLDLLRGARIGVHAAQGVREAVALGVAADGGLRVHFDDGDEHILHSGEISIRAVA